MTRFLRLSNEAVVGENEIVVEVPHDIVPCLALEFSLLLAGLADSLRIQASSGPTIMITVGSAVTAGRAVVTGNKTQMLSFEFSRNQAEYLQAVLLRAHRDGVAEVSHVHIEGVTSDTLFDLTVLFETHGEPMTADEAMTMLDG